MEVGSEGAVGDDADAHAEFHEGDDEIEAIQLHGGSEMGGRLGEPAFEGAAGGGGGCKEKPALVAEMTKDRCWRLPATRGRRSGGWKHDGEFVRESVNQRKRFGEGRRTRTDDEVEFPGFQIAEELLAAVMNHLEARSALLTHGTKEKAGEVGERNGIRNANPDQLRARIERLMKLPVEFGHVAKNGAGAFLEEQAGGGEFDPAGGAFQERSAEAGFHALDLPGESALAETGACGSAGETAMAGDEVEEPKLVEIERNGGEELMHSVHEPYSDYAFPAIPNRS